MAKVKAGSKPAKKKLKDKKVSKPSVVKLSKVSGKKKKKRKIEDEEKELKKVTSSRAKKRELEQEDEDEDDDAVLEDEILDEDDEDEDDDVTSDESDEDEDDSEGSQVEDYSDLDPGPDRNDVPFGDNCASCKLFVKWDDPRREDPEWLEKMDSVKHRCPKLFGPIEFDVSDADPQKFIAQADDEACDKYSLDDEKAPEHFIDALNNVKSNFEIPEFRVLMLSAKHILRGKEMEKEMGYRYNQTVTVLLKGSSKTLEAKAKVFDFQKKKGKEVVVRGVHPETGKTFKAYIPALRAIEVQE